MYRKRRIRTHAHTYAGILVLLFFACPAVVANHDIDKPSEASADEQENKPIIFQGDINDSENNLPSPPFGKGGMGGFSDELDKQFKNALHLIDMRSYHEAENILLNFERQGLYLDKIYFPLGRIYKELDLLDKAEDYFKKAAVHNELLKDYALKLLADTYAAKKEYDKAVETFRQIQNKTLIRDAKQSEITSLLELKNEEAALQVLSWYIQEYPSDWKYKLLLAQILKGRQKKRATSLFKDIYIEATPFAGDALEEMQKMNTAIFTQEEMLRRADNLLRNGSFGSAEAAFKKVLKSARDASLTDKINFSIGTCQFRQKKYSEAARTFDLVKTSEAMYWKARALYRIDEINAFEIMIKRLEKEYPGSQYIPKLLIALAEEKRRDGDVSGAADVFKRVINDFPEEAENALWGLAWVHYTNGNYKEAEQNYSKLSSLKDYGRYRYWEAKSRAMLHKDCMSKKTEPTNADNPCPDPDTASAYRALLKDTGYYGFLARRQLRKPDTHDNRESSLESGPYRSSGTEMQEPQEVEIRDTILSFKVPDGHMYKIIEMLVFLEMNKEALGEIKAAIRSARNLDEIKYLGRVAFQLHEYRSIIYAVEGLANREILPLAYPLGFWDTVGQASEKEGIDPYIILALMREESRFDPDALSPAGAIGLMQLMPFTAHRFKKALHIELANKSEIYDVKKNIFIGTHYLSLLIKEFTVLPLAIASYNAGENRIRKWLLESKHKDMEEFIEDIPYQETRNYVKRVLRSYWQYRTMRGLPVSGISYQESESEAGKLVSDN